MVDTAEVEGVERTFDRIPSENPARNAYRMEGALEAAGGLRSFTWRHLLQLDQGTYECPICGQHGACTGFCAAMEAASRPKPVFGELGANVTDVERTAHQVYHRAKELDVWPGTDYEGSSVDGACLAGRELGWWDAWVWAHGSGEAKAQQVFRAVGFRGPVMVGTWWRRNMKADADGFFSYSGDRLGGHAYLLSKVRLPVKHPRTAAQQRFLERAPRGAVWSPNSWGGAGQGWLTFEDLAAAMGEDGDAALVVNRLKP